jgi:release factor glutamine methyltransferase
VSPRHSLADLLTKTSSFFAAKGIDTARLDAELLLGEVLSLDRLQLYTSFDRPMNEEELDAYRALVKRRAKREPVAYILGCKEFYGREFKVDSRVLIPRPDTEVLVDEVLERLPDTAEGVLLDYGTGSGAIAITLAAERPNLRVLATDLSEDALTVAKENAKLLGVDDRVGFIRSDGLSSVPERFRGALCAIVSNPPYIDEREKESLMPDVRDHEPHTALFPGPDPLLHYRRISAEARDWLASDGFASVEVGAGQAKYVAELFEAHGWLDSRIRSDLARHERVVSAFTEVQPITPPS